MSFRDKPWLRAILSWTNFFRLLKLYFCLPFDSTQTAQILKNLTKLFSLHPLVNYFYTFDFYIFFIHLLSNKFNFHFILNIAPLTDANGHTILYRLKSSMKWKFCILKYSSVLDAFFVVINHSTIQNTFIILWEYLLLSYFCCIYCYYVSFFSFSWKSFCVVKTHVFKKFMHGFSLCIINNMMM